MKLLDALAGCSACACGLPGACDPYWQITDGFRETVAASILVLLGAIATTVLIKIINLKKDKVKRKKINKTIFIALMFLLLLLISVNTSVFFLTSTRVNPEEQVLKGAKFCADNPHIQPCEY